MKNSVALLALCLGICLTPALALPPSKHAIADGSRTRAVHNIPLLDENLAQIRSSQLNPHPFSTEATCGDCHNYDKISTGWHFNSASGTAPAGRPGEPWFVVDDDTGTQIPVTARNWPNAFKPEDLGLTPWEFTKRFARHMPGGDFGEMPDAESDSKARWEISGRLEVNCLTCHNASPMQNPSDGAIQTARENFRWAATAASGLGVVENMASRLPNSYDPVLGADPDNAWAAPPRVRYHEGIFDAKDRVFFDVARRAPANRCYFCHSAVKNETVDEGFKHDQDVHLAAGLSCTDCHRNGLDHNIARGYEGDPATPTSLTCRGCHLGEGTTGDVAVAGGRLTAPRPAHKGLPPIHLEKMSCTSCHSGPWPEADSQTFRTSRANRLGIHGRAQWDTDLPGIQAPVFARSASGVIEPHYAVWPAFWGVLKDGKITPLSLDIAQDAVDTVRAPKPAPVESAAPASSEVPAETSAAPATSAVPEASTPMETSAAPESRTAEEKRETTPPFTDAEILNILATLSEKGLEGEPVYVASGQVSRKTASGLTRETNPVAEPYLWPIGHDVRPAAQSLGAGGCTDCHSANAPIFFGTVRMAGPAEASGEASVSMHQVLGMDAQALRLWALQFQVRPLFKVLAGLATLLVAGIALMYGFRGLYWLTRRMSGEAEK